MPMGKPRRNDLGLKNMYSTFDQPKKNDLLDKKLASDDGAKVLKNNLYPPNNGNIDKHHELAGEVSDRSYQGSAKSKTSQVRGPGVLLKESSGFVVVPSSDEVRRRELATGDFHRPTNETSKASNARTVPDRVTLRKRSDMSRKIDSGRADPEPQIEEAPPARKHERSPTPVDEPEQLEEHAISGP